MARVTVEDCVVKIPNRFELVMLAAQRARSISSGMPLTVDRDNDKNPVVALREIADTTIDLDELQNSLVRGLQRQVEMDEPEEDKLDVLAIQQEMANDIAVAALGEGASLDTDEEGEVDIGGDAGTGAEDDFDLGDETAEPR